MSRIGKAAIEIPAGVTVDFTDAVVTVKGPKGTLKQKMNPMIKVVIKDSKANVERSSEEKRYRSMHGLYRSILANMIKGVSEGFEKVLEIQGVGYRAAKEGKKLSLSMGYSHPVIIDPPEGIDFVLEGQTKIKVVGTDKWLVGQTASNIKYVRAVEPYKGKGIRYQGQHVRKKAGKAAAKAAA